MVTRVSTPGNYSAVLANLLAAQERQQNAGQRLSTQRNGDDLKAFSRNSEMLTGMRTIHSRVTVFQDQAIIVADRLANQDTALNRIADAAAAVRQSIADAIASGKADTLMEEVSAQFKIAVDAINTRYNGKYLFAGGQATTQPLPVDQLSDLSTPVIVADLYQDDLFKASAKIDDSTEIEVGVLAKELTLEMMELFQTLQDAPVPYDGPITPAQQVDLEQAMRDWEGVRASVTLTTARNGLLQKRVDEIRDDLVSRDNMLTGMMGDVTDADMASVAAELEQAQISVQAAAHVFKTLQDSSLLNLLR
jgi:flagellar hook-associated protein 3 FlgL